MILPALLLSQLCPPDATAASAAMTLYTVPSAPVAGRPAEIRVRLLWLNWSPDGSAASFGGGAISITVAGERFTLTNTVPQIGPPPCADATSFEVALPYVFANAGQAFVAAEYAGHADTLPVRASNVRVVQVVLEGKLMIEAWDSLPQVWWYGAGTYELQASEDLQTWVALAVLTGSNGFYHYEDGAGKQRRFYRYKRL